MPAISSSMMTFVAYDKEHRTLTITFTSGQRYDYFDVPRSVYDGLRTAASAGTYFGEEIRDQYPYQRRWS